MCSSVPSNLLLVITKFLLTTSEHIISLGGDRYVKCDPKSPCQLALVDPRPGASASSSALSDQALVHSFREGDIVVFPSWLSHYVPPSPQLKQTEPRISVSFNAAVKILLDSTRGNWSVHFSD